MQRPSWVCLLVAVASCGTRAEGGADSPDPVDPNTARVAEVDGFSDGAGTMFTRAGDLALPAPDEPIDFDQAPFVTLGLGPAGEHIRYYHFDVREQTPAPMYVLVREDTHEKLAGQLPIVDVLPGSAGYNDFFRVNQVTVPASYKANAITSLEQIHSLGLTIVANDEIVNRPIVPKGSTATRRLAGQDSAPVRAWYRGTVAYAFAFEDPTPTTTARDGTLLVKLSSIFVTFNVNPDQAGGGVCSGVMTEAGTEQSHNVAAALPPDPAYSPLWNVFAYDNVSFDSVHDIASAEAAPLVANIEAPYVNCPIIETVP